MKILTAAWQEQRHIMKDIRRKVFIEEQHVDETEEWEQNDELSSTVHLVAYLDEVIVGTARILASGKIGRLAVLKAYRGRGIGSQLTQIAIQKALCSGPQDIYLDSQLHAIKLYQAFGFVAEGDHFMDAGIEHVRMRLHLSQAVLSLIYHRDHLGRNNHLISSVHETIQHITQQCAHAQKHINILSELLQPDIYAAQPLVDAISNLARKNRHSRVRILIKDSTVSRARSHALVVLAQRLSSAMEIRVLRKSSQEAQTEGTEQSYVICDRKHLISFNDERKIRARANYNAAPEIKQLMHSFEYLWENHSEPDPNLRRLCL